MSGSNQKLQGLSKPLGVTVPKAKPPEAIVSKAHREWFSDVWAKKNRSFELVFYKRAKESLRKKLEDAWSDDFSRPWPLDFQQPYLALQKAWAHPEHRAESSVPWPADCEAMRLMNGMVMPESIVKLLADAGFDAEKCCDPNLPPDQKTLSWKRKNAKRSAGTQETEPPEAKKSKTKSGKVSGNTSAPPTSQPPLSLTDVNGHLSAYAFLQNMDNTVITPSKSTGADTQAAPLNPCQKPNESITTSTPTQLNPPVDVPQAAPAAGTPVRTPVLDIDTVIQKAISIKTAEISAAIAAQLRQHDEVQQKRDEEQEKRDEDQKKREEAQQKHDETVQNTLEQVKKCVRGVREAMKEDERARRDLKLSLALLEGSLAAASEQLVDKTAAGDVSEYDINSILGDLAEKSP